MMGLTRTQQEMVVSNLPLSRMLASRLSRGMQTADREDACSLATLGLIRAVQLYDTQKGPFGRYARKFIFGEVWYHRKAEEKIIKLFGVSLSVCEAVAKEEEPSLYVRDLLEEYGKTLPTSWRRIIKWRLKGLELKEIADKAGLTFQRVSQIIAESRVRILKARQEIES